MEADYRKDSVYYLGQAIEMLHNISDELYSNNKHEHFESGVGRHLRHILDHYLSLLDGIGTVVNYDTRKRDPRLETDRQYAAGLIKNIITRFEGLEFEIAPLLVESTPGTAAEGQFIVVESTLQRELQFLTSHTIHHYAIIGLILRLQGYMPESEFGVAPSTLRYEAHLKEKAN